MTPSTSKSNYRYGFALLRNAREFVQSAVEYAQRDEERLWKFAVLHMTAALELILKAKLAMKDHRQLVATPAEIAESQFDEGNFRSIGIEQCLERLGHVCGFTLAARERHVIKALQRLRNRITHYIDPVGDVGAVKATIAAGLNLFIEMNDSEFLGEDPWGTKPMSALILDLHRHTEFVKERLSALSVQLRSSTRPHTRHADECADCLQDAAVIVDDSVKCLFCGRVTPTRLYAALLSSDGSVEPCPECGRESVALHSWAGREPTYECFCCGYFRGPELRWRDAAGEISRLHFDR